MKKSLLLVLALVLVLAAPLGVLADEESPMAIKSFQPVELDGEEVEISAYLVNGENYFRIRDLAAILKDTEAKFNVEFDPENHNVILEKDGDYEIIEGDLEDLPEGEQETIDSLHPVYLKYVEKPIEIKSYNINGNNYFRLRDLGKVLGFGVAYDYNTHTVLLSSTDLELEDIKVEEKEEVEKEEVEEDKDQVIDSSYFDSIYYNIARIEPGLNSFYIGQHADQDDVNWIELNNPIVDILYQNTFGINTLFPNAISIKNIELEDESYILTGTGHIVIGEEQFDIKIYYEFGPNPENPDTTTFFARPTFGLDYLDFLGIEY